MIIRYIFSFFILYTSLAQAKETIGFIAGFSGSDNNTAKELFRGVEVFFEQNPKAKNEFEIQKEDNESSITKTVEVLEKMKNDKIKIVFGIANSNEALAAAKFTNENKMIFITPFAANTDVTKDKQYTFRVCFTDKEQGKFLGEFAINKLKSKKVLVLKNVDSKYSQGLSGYFIEHLNNKNIKIFEEFYANDLTEENYLKIRQSYLKNLPDVIFIPDHIMKASLLTKKLKPILDKDVRILGGDGFGGRKIFMAVMGEETDLNLYYSTHWHEGLVNSANTKFLKSYKNLFKNDTPSSGAAFTYDLMNMIYSHRDIIKNPMFSVEKLASEIKNKVYNTTSGNLKFEKNDNSPQKPIIMMSFKSGKYRLEK